jgi:opacity protein-like surface antigen
MRKVLIALAATAVAMAATPALANEARVEARGGVIWFPGTSKATAGIAAGYDFDLGSSTFAGVEISGDKVLTSGTKVAFGFTARGGVKLGEDAKLFAAGGYTTGFCNGCDGNVHLGAGVNYGITKNIYLTGEYRHFFKNGTSVSSDALVAGVGYKF